MAAVSETHVATAEELRERARRKRLIIQALLLVFTIVVVWSAIRSAQVNLTALGITSGFSFLERSTGWDYSFSLVERSINDSYLKTLWIGLMNTMFVGFICIFTATILGFLIGTARDATNIAVKTAATIYVQIFRNVPLILQAIFLYAVLIHLPGPREAYSYGDVIFMSNRGLLLPGLNVSSTVALWIVIASVLLGVGLVLSKRFSLLRGALIWFAGSVVIALVAGVMYKAEEGGLFSVPELAGLRFRGGITVSVELWAMIVSITAYGSAYIAEVVRGGLNEVPRGLVEAGQALGLSRGSIWSRIKIPMALRSIVPPLGNQWIFIMKATTIGIAIGFSDMFYIVSNSITQSGQTLELIAILMGSFLVVNFSIALSTNLLNERLKLKAH